MKRAADSSPNRELPAGRPEKQQAMTAPDIEAADDKSEQIQIFAESVFSRGSASTSKAPGMESSSFGGLPSSSTSITSPTHPITKPYQSWLQSLPDKRLEAIICFMLHQEVELPPLPKEESWFQVLFSDVSKPVAVMRHHDLLTGGVNCNGTYEVSEWISNVIKKAVSSSREQNYEKCPFARLGLTNAEIERVSNKLEELAPKLDFLQRTRDLARLSHVGLAATALPQQSWAEFELITTLAVLSNLKRDGIVAISSDFGFRDKAAPKDWKIRPKYYPDVHATSVVIKRIGESDNCDVHFFETNGKDDALVSRDVVNKKRISDGDETKTLQRHWSFALSDFEPVDYVSRPPLDSPDNPKIFARKTAHAQLRLLSQTLSMSNESQQYQDGLELEKISRIMFPNQRKGFLSYEDMIAYQETIAKGMSMEDKVVIEKQRLHASQRTASCELKSTTVAACFMLEDELAYQVLNALLIISTKKDLDPAEIETYHPKFTQLNTDLDDVKARIRGAQNSRLQPLDKNPKE